MILNILSCANVVENVVILDICMIPIFVRGAPQNIWGLSIDGLLELRGSFLLTDVNL